MEKIEHAFLYQDAARVVHVTLSDGRRAMFPDAFPWLSAVSWAHERAVTIEVRT